MQTEWYHSCLGLVCVSLRGGASMCARARVFRAILLACDCKQFHI